MKQMNKILMSWSCGKDSAYALYQLQRCNQAYGIAGTLITLTKAFERTSIHGVRRELLEAQIERLGLRLYVLELPYPCSNERYSTVMETFLTTEAVKAGVSHIAFGDLFLESVRHYREAQLAMTSVQPLFPLWQRDTALLAKEMISSGFKAVITCVDPKKLDISFAGRMFDESFLKDLPKDVDPCGENGEFHTFVYDAPNFSQPIDIAVGKVIERDGFVFADVCFQD